MQEITAIVNTHTNGLHLTLFFFCVCLCTEIYGKTKVKTKVVFNGRENCPYEYVQGHKQMHITPTQVFSLMPGCLFKRFVHTAIFFITTM